MADADSGLSNTDKKYIPQKKKRDKPKASSDYVIRKRVPPQLPRREKDIYVTLKSNFEGQLSRCEKFLESAENEVVIHGLGAAVTRAVALALQLQANHHGTVEVDVNTSTVDIVDDLEPQRDQFNYETQTRQNSSVHVRAYRKIFLA